MRRLVNIFLFVTLLGFALSGCRQSAAERRLVEIDTLIARGTYDSALARLRAVDTTTLARDELAYHGLLMTHAAYKAYDSAYVDTTWIARARQTYADGGPYDRHIRTLLYSGCVAEDLGDPLVAMRWYKRTERDISPNDIFNSGYVQMREAILLQSQYSQKSAISKFKKALSSFQQCSDIRYQYDCISELGAIYRTIDQDSAMKYIMMGCKLTAREKMETEYYTQLTSLAGLYYYQNDYQKTIETSKNVLIHTHDSTDLFLCSHYACDAYCALSKVDSALLVLKLSPLPHTSADSILHSNTLAEIAKVTGKSEIVVNQLLEVVDAMTETQFLTSLREELKDVESDQLTEWINDEKEKNHHFSSMIIALIILVILVAITFILLHLRKNKEHKRQILLFGTEIERFANLKNCLEDAITGQSFFVSNVLDILKSAPKTPADKIKKIEKLLQSLNDNEQMWAELANLANFTHGNIINDITEKCPDISEKDKKLIVLYCCGFSDTSVKTVLGYTNIKSVYNRKRSIPKEKLGMSENISIIDLIEQYKIKNSGN